MMKRANNIRSWLIVFVALQMVTPVINPNISFGSDRIKSLQGFNWYNEKPEQKKEKVENTQKQETAQTAPAEDLHVYEKNIRSLQERHKKAHRQALDNPTTENILTEMYLEKEMMQKSQQQAIDFHEQAFLQHAHVLDLKTLKHSVGWATDAINL